MASTRVRYKQLGDPGPLSRLAQRCRRRRVLRDRVSSAYTPWVRCDAVVYFRRKRTAIPRALICERVDDGQARGESRVWHISSTEPEAMWSIDDDVHSYSPQFKFPVHQGILDYNGTKCVPLLINESILIFVVVPSQSLSGRWKPFQSHLL